MTDQPPPDATLAQLGRDLEGAATLYESARRLIDRHFASGAAAGCPLNRRLENLRERLTELLEDHADMTAPLAREMAEAQRPRQGVPS
jgi:hypothetical protein